MDEDREAQDYKFIYCKNSNGGGHVYYGTFDKCAIGNGLPAKGMTSVAVFKRFNIFHEEIPEGKTLSDVRKVEAHNALDKVIDKNEFLREREERIPTEESKETEVTDTTVTRLGSQDTSYTKCLPSVEDEDMLQFKVELESKSHI